MAAHATELLTWSDARLHRFEARTRELQRAGLNRDEAARRAYEELQLPRRKASA